MKRYDLIIVGAGPSGLSAAIEAAKRGLKVVVFDENEKPELDEVLKNLEEVEEIAQSMRLWIKKNL